MSVYNKVTNSVADAVSKIMNEKLHPNQQKLDVHEPEKDKLTAKDFEMLRAKKGIAASRLEQKSKEKMKEETEQIQEYTSVGGKYVHRQKEVKDAEAGVTDWDKEEKMAKDTVKPAAKKRAYGAHQNRRTNTKLYKEMIESFKTGGLKALSKTIAENKIEEEASEEEFNKELADQKAKFDGKKKTADVAKPSVQAVQNEDAQIDEVSKTTLKGYLKGIEKENDPRIHGDSAGAGNQMSAKARSLGRTEQDKEDSRYEGSKLAKRKLGASGTIPAKVMAKESVHTEIQMVDLTDASQKPQISTVDLEEKSLTEPEMKKKEEVVKSMKKGLAGFKERYGDRAKSVMYATATKIAKDKA